MPTTTSIASKRSVRALTMTIAVGAVAGLSLTACSSSGSTGSGNESTSGKTPTEALAAAVHNISNGNAEAFQLSIKPDDAMIAAMNKDSKDPQSAQIVKSVFGNGGIVVKFTASSSKPLKDLKPGENPNVEFDVTAGGTDLMDMRSVSGALYAKVNVPQFLQLSGKPASSLTSQLGQVPPDFQAPLQALMADKWVGVSAQDLKGLEQMAQTLGQGDLGSTPTAASSTGAGSQMLANVEAQLMKALTQDATVTDKGSGQYQVTGKVKTIGQDVLQALGPVLNSVPGKSKADMDKMRSSLNSVPDSENITFDIWVKSNQISELQVDLAQFLPADKTGGGHLPVDAKFSQSAGSVSAPSDVTNIDVQKLISSFGAGL